MQMFGGWYRNVVDIMHIMITDFAMSRATIIWTKVAKILSDGTIVFYRPFSNA